MAQQPGPGAFVVLLAAAGGVACHYGTASAIGEHQGWWSILLPWLVPPLAVGLVIGCAQAAQRRDPFDVLPAGLGASGLLYLVLSGSLLLDSAQGGPIGALGMGAFFAGIWFATSPLVLAGALLPFAVARLIRRRPRSVPG